MDSCLKYNGFNSCEDEVGKTTGSVSGKRRRHAFFLPRDAKFIAVAYFSSSTLCFQYSRLY